MMENNFNKEEIEKVLFNLLGGDIIPIGDSVVDEDSYNRLTTLLELMKDLHYRVCIISNTYKNSDLASCKKIGQACSEYLDWLEE